MSDTDGFRAGVAVEMAEKMRIKEGDDERTVLSKKLSYVLRHGAKQLHLEVDDSGYVCVNDLLACNELFAGVALEALLEVVKLSNVDKERYETSEQDGNWFIRATGKHTMQGLTRKSKRMSREGGSDGGGAGSEQRPARHLSEEEFCARWRLDRLAKVRLAELDASSRQLAMQQFSPGPQVPASDFPKVFVAFCKRFKQKAKEDAIDLDDDFEDTLTSAAQPRTGAAPRSRGKKKSGRGREPDKASGRGAGSSRRGVADSDNRDALSSLQPSSKVNGLSFIEIDTGHMNPYYPSPGSTPRSDESPGRVRNQGLLLQSIGTPGPTPTASTPSVVTAPQRQLPATLLSTQGTPTSASPLATPAPMTAPPPPAYPPQNVPMLPAGVRLMPPQAPPPPTHAPQVLGFNSFEFEDGMVQHDRGDYQDVMAARAHASQWGVRGAQAYPQHYWPGR